MSSSYEPVIGLEIHAQLLTATKIFCACRTRFGAAPNTQTCPVCLGLPGALPVLNARAVDLAARAALALGCAVAPVSVFARKNYFYPDLPKGYQISQYDQPLATGGAIELGAGRDASRVHLTRLHLEEDAGKSLHEGFAGADRATCIDFNRSGVPLIEIVTEPDLRSSADAGACFSRLREMLVALGVNDGNMEEGSLRCDANVSVRPAGSQVLGVKTEVKNLNSFRHVQHALAFETDRQVEVLRGGGRVVAETRLWDPLSGATVPMRSKEEADDYRYFPEPDLPPLRLEVEWIEALRRSLPEMPEQTRRRFVQQYGLPEYDAGVLTQSPALAAYFEATAAAAGSAKAASNWVMGELLRKLKESGASIADAGIGPDALGGLIRLVESGTISGPVAKEVFERMYGSGRSAADIVAAEGLARIDDAEAIDAAVRDVLAQHATAVAQYRAGRTQTFGFLVGQVIKATRGKADPVLVNRIVKRELEG